MPLSRVGRGGMKNREKFSWLIALTLLVMGLSSGGCTYDTCESDEDCNQAEGEICLPAGSCGKAGDSCTHGEEPRNCKIGTHSRGTNRGNFGECNKDINKNGKGRVEICVGGVWVASRARFEEVRQAYEQTNFQGAPLITGFDTSKQDTIFGVLSPADIDKIRLDIAEKRYVLCGDDSDNEKPYGDDINELTGQPIDKEFISREICNGLNDDCDADPKITDVNDPKYLTGSVDEDFVGERVVVRNVSAGELQINLEECLSGTADADGFCLCAEEGAKGACVRRGVQTCETKLVDDKPVVQLACSGVEVAPTPSRFACNGTDDNCNGIIDEFATLEPTDIPYSFNKVSVFDPRVDVMSATSIEIKERTSYLFATEVAAGAPGVLPEVDLNVLHPGVNQLSELLLAEQGDPVGTKQIYGLSPHLESAKPPRDDDQTAGGEYSLLFYLGQVEYNCTNGLDDDGDGLVDCEENTAGTGECATECNESGSQCSNGQDDDSDSFIDCEDSECFEFCAQGSVREDCAQPGDEDENGLHDCADPVCCGVALCQQTHFCKIELCGNGQDDDGDGAKDCDDTECCDMPACEYAVACRVETMCDSNIIDGDGDGLVGCDDPDCCTRNSRCMTGNPATQGPIQVCVSEDCTGGNDTNLNGLTGCNDPACAGHASCLASSPTESEACLRSGCTGATCAGLDVCKEFVCKSTLCGSVVTPGPTPEETALRVLAAQAKCSNFNFCNEDCSDNIDNNGDGQIDEADARCANTCAANPSEADCLSSGGVTLTCASAEFKYQPQCMPCEFGGSACAQPSCDSHPMCADANDDTVADSLAEGCNVGDTGVIGNAAKCNLPVCAESVFCEDRRELCHNFVDDNADGLVDCEDIASCGYSAFCSQELWVQIRSFVEDTTSGTITSVQRANLCLTCDDKAALSGGRDVEATLGLRKFNYKNRPDFYEVVPRANGEFFVMYSRTRESANRVVSSLFSTSVNVTDAAPETPQAVRLVGAEIRNPIRAAKISGKQASSEVQMILLEECTRPDTCTACPTPSSTCRCSCETAPAGSPRLGELRLFKGAISSSTNALDIYASKVEGVGADGNPAPSLTDEIPIQNFSRLASYPFDITASEDRVWIAYVAGDASQGETMKVQAYDLTSAGGATDLFKEVIEGVPPNDKPVVYPLKKVQEGWVINTRPVPGDDKDSTDASTQSTYQFSGVQLTPLCQDVGTTNPLCDQMLLSFYESGSTLAAPHLVSVNTAARSNSRIGDQAPPGEIPLGSIINESKTGPGAYTTLQNGHATHVFVESREVKGYRLQTGGFLTGEEPQIDFIYSLDEVPLHIRVAKILDEQGNNNNKFFVRTFPENVALLIDNTDTLQDEIAKLPEEFQVDTSRIDLELRDDTRVEYHIHWSTLVGTSNLVPFADELSCDSLSSSFAGYGLADSVPVAAPATPPGN